MVDRLFRRALLIVLPLLLVGGAGVPLPQTDQLFSHWITRDTSVVDGQHTSQCASNAMFGSSTPRRCIIPPNMGVQFVEFGLTLTSAFTTAAVEDCIFTLHVGALNDALGDEITSSAITTGEAVANAAGTCQPTPFTLNAAGEGCTREINLSDANATRPFGEGGWYEVVATDADGADTCQSADAVNFFVLANKL